MINIGDQLFINNKWYWDVMGISNDMAIIQVYYMYGYPKPQISRTSFKFPIKDMFLEEDNLYKIVSVDETLLKKTIGNLINQILIQDSILESVNEDGGAAASGVAMASTAVSGMGAVTSPGSPSTPGVSGTAGSDIAVGGSFLGTYSPAGYNFNTKKKKIKRKPKPHNEEFTGFDFKKYNDSQKNKGIIDTRWSRRHIKELINLGKKLNKNIQPEELNNSVLPNSWRPVDVIHYDENTQGQTIENLDEDDYKTRLIEFVTKPYNNVADSKLSNEICINKESLINNPIVKIKSYLKRFKEGNEAAFKEASDDFINTYDLFLK